jgi:hypothetical protein
VCFTVICFHSVVSILGLLFKTFFENSGETIKIVSALELRFLFHACMNEVSRSHIYKCSRDSSVVKRWATDWMIRVPTGAGNFFLHQRVQTGSGAHPASYPMGTRGGGSFSGDE